MNLKAKFLVLAAASILSSVIQAANPINPLLPDSKEIKWVDTSNIPGAKIAILAGNPNKKEFYVARLKLPANFVIPSHSHFTNEYDTIISGTYYMGNGNEMKKNATVALPAGSFIIVPARAIHYGFTTEETVIEISGIGPWGTTPKKLENNRVLS